MNTSTTGDACVAPTELPMPTSSRGNACVARTRASPAPHKSHSFKCILTVWILLDQGAQLSSDFPPQYTPLRGSVPQFWAVREVTQAFRVGQGFRVGDRPTMNRLSNSDFRKLAGSRSWHVRYRDDLGRHMPR